MKNLEYITTIRQEGDFIKLGSKNDEKEHKIIYYAIYKINENTNLNIKVGEEKL